MFDTKLDLDYVNKRITQANGNFKIDIGNGFKKAKGLQWERIMSGLRLGLYHVKGYTEKCIGVVPYEISISIANSAFKREVI